MTDLKNSRLLPRGLGARGAAIVTVLLVLATTGLGEPDAAKPALKKGDEFVVWCAAAKPPAAVRPVAKDSLGRSIWYVHFSVLDVTVSSAQETLLRLGVSADDWRAEASYSLPSLALTKLKVGNDSIAVAGESLLVLPPGSPALPVILDGMNCPVSEGNRRLGGKPGQWWEVERMLDSARYRYGLGGSPTTWVSRGQASDWTVRSFDKAVESVALDTFRDGSVTRISMTRVYRGYWWLKALAQTGREGDILLGSGPMRPVSKDVLPSAELMECRLFDVPTDQKEVFWRPAWKKGMQFKVLYRQYGVFRWTNPPDSPSWSAGWFATYEVTNVEDDPAGMIELQVELSAAPRAPFPEVAVQGNGRYRVHLRKQGLTIVDVYDLDQKRMLVSTQGDTSGFGWDYPVTRPFLYELPALPAEAKSSFVTRKSQTNQYDEMIRFYGDRLEADLFKRGVATQDVRLVASWKRGDPFWSHALYTVGQEPRLEATLVPVSTKQAP